MSDVKYEMIFGDEKLFDCAPWDSVCVERFINPELVSVYVHYRTIDALLNTLIEREAVSCASNRPDIAIRRIIPEPKRWTWEDKKAGRLPEVGAKCRQGHKDEIVVAVTEKFVVTECQDMSVCTTRKDVFMRSYNPIETPAEKAQRERDEWIDNACSFICFYDIGRVDAIKSLEITYDKLKSGELSMLGKE